MALSVARIITPIIVAISRAAEPATSASTKIKAAVRRNASDIDKLQQYVRRENIRIHGMMEEFAENLKKKVVVVANAVGVNIASNAINVVHRAVTRDQGKLKQVLNCWFSFAPVFQWCCSAPRGSPGVGRNTFLSSPHLCFIIVFICGLFVSRDDPLIS